MLPQKIKDSVYSVGANHWDRELFDELIPLPDGTSYNSYLIKGERKNALIDTVDPSKQDILLRNLDKLGIDTIDYIISNHAEQDHSGSIPAVLDKFPEAKIVTNSKCKDMLLDLLPLDEEVFFEVEDGDTLTLGRKSLQFLNTPWAHWPETLSTYLQEDNILFPCDLFGSHLATSNLFMEDKEKSYLAAKRYYAEIMMPFRRPIKNDIKKISELDVDIIAASHGPIYNEPDFIIGAYKNWVSDESKNEVVLPYVSMHGSTQKMVDHIVDSFIETNVQVKPFNLASTDVGQLAMALVDASTIVLATPTVLTGPHPKALYAAYLVGALRPKLKAAALIGSFGWGTKVVDDVKDMLSGLNIEFFEPVLTKGLPDEGVVGELDDLAEKIRDFHENNDDIIIY